MVVPRHDKPVGPMTRARQRRLAAIFATAQAAGIASVATGAGPAREAWATGVMFPGAGFIYTRDPAHFAVAMAAFALAGVLWFGTGNHIAPPVVWAGAAALAARRAAGKQKHWRGTPYAVATVLGVLAYEQLRERRKRFKSQQKQAEAANELLRTAVPPLRGDDRPPVHVGRRDGRRGAGADAALRRHGVPSRSTTGTTGTSSSSSSLPRCATRSTT